MSTIRTYIRKHKKDSDTGVVWISFYIKREKINFSTSVSIQESAWNEVKCVVTSADKQYRDKNLIIETIVARVNNVFVKYRLKNKVITRDGFFKTYNRPDDYDTFFDFVDVYRRKISDFTEDSTMDTHKSAIDKLKAFNPKLHFDDITEDWLDTYYSHLRKKMDNCENTAYKNMSIIRKYVRAAWKAGYMDENPFEHWSIKRTRSSYEYLNPDELDLMIKLYNSGCLGEVDHKCLEFFLFLCFSSLHIGDASKLKLEQFTDNSFTYFRIKNRNKKPEPVVVPISAPLRSMLKNIVGTRGKGLVFDKVPTSINVRLKNIAKQAGVDKPISCKAGRHTFATIYLKRTKDLASLKDILGHSELRETLIYAHVLDESKQEGILVFNDFDV